MQRFHNIIFDLDGLLADTEPLHQRAFNLVLEAMGVEHRYETEEYGRIMTGRSVLENAEYVRERFALAPSAEDIAAAHRALFNLLIADADNVNAMPGVDALLDFLHAQNVRLALASSSVPDHIEKMLRAINQLHAFGTIVGNTGDVKPKPAPDIYLKTLHVLQAGARDSVAIEDSVSGVRSAHGAGLFVIAVPNEYTRWHDLSEANVVAKDLFQVRDFFSREG